MSLELQQQIHKRYRRVLLRHSSLLKRLEALEAAPSDYVQPMVAAIKNLVEQVSPIGYKPSPQFKTPTVIV